MLDEPPAPQPSSTKRTVALALGAIGVVYGDIGTSPLYTMRQAFVSPSMNVADESHVLGVCSLIVWALLIGAGHGGVYAAPGPGGDGPLAGAPVRAHEPSHNDDRVRYYRLPPDRVVVTTERIAPCSRDRQSRAQGVR